MNQNENIQLLMVGDFDQNIYGWRGAKYINIAKFIR
jgi:superfamily I DNA/RNA helicase